VEIQRRSEHGAQAAQDAEAEEKEAQVPALLMTSIGHSRLSRRDHSELDGASEYEKRADSAYPWLWDWTNELFTGIFQAAQEIAAILVYDDSATEYRDITERTWGAFTEMGVWPSTT